MKATKSFSKDSEIGAGGFGKVYVGLLDDNRQVAIKRASEVSLQGSKEFRNEIMLLSRLHHRHLVRLEGFCDDKFEQVLVIFIFHSLDFHGLSKHSTKSIPYSR
jgi:serine/threonine protein kinase